MLLGRQKQHAIWLIVALFLALGTCYVIALPIFEGADEISHFRVAEFIADNQEIPHIITHAEQVGHEAGQPPLYYALLAPFISPVDRSDFDQTAFMNPHFLHLNSNHVWVHLTDEVNRWQGITLAVRVSRFMSLIMGAVTVFATWVSARLLIAQSDKKEEFALLAAALVAFNPQFLTISASINNDNLVVMFCTLALFLTLRWQKTDDHRPVTPFIIGAVTGLAILSKVSGLAFGLVIGWVLIGRWRKSGRFAPAFKDGLFVIAGVLVTAGWWLWRNQSLYGDPLGLGALRIAHSGTYRAIPLTLSETVSESQLLLKSFWLYPGSGTVFGPDWFYWVVNIAVLIGFLGFLIPFFNKNTLKHKQPIATLSIWMATVTLLLFYWMSTVGATSQGRLLYPALSAFALLNLTGFWQMGTLGRWLSRLLALFLFGFAVATPFLITYPAFAHPATLPADFDYPNSFGEPAFTEHIELLGHAVPTQNLSVGEEAQIQLFWKATGQVPDSFFVTLHLVDTAGTEVSRYEGYPLNGRYSTVTWQANQPFTEQITMPPISANAEAGLATIFVELTSWDGSFSTDLRPLSQQIKIRFDQATTQSQNPPEITTDVTFGDLATLTGYTLKQSANMLNIDFFWLVQSPTSVNQTVFVHLLDANGNLVAQADSPPRNGTYPTQYWEQGEKIIDPHQISLESVPAGDYNLSIGFYDPVSGVRLPSTLELGYESDSFLFGVNLK